jgi:hypothetical protein
MTKYKIITFAIIFACLIVIGVSLKKIFFNNPLSSAEQNLVKIHQEIYTAKQISINGKASSTGVNITFDIYLDNESGDYSYKIYQNDQLSEGYMKKGEDAYSSYSDGKWMKQDSQIGESMFPILKTTAANNLLENITLNKDDENKKLSFNPLKGTTQIKTNNFFTNLIKMLSMYQSPNEAGLTEDTTMNISQDLKGGIKELAIDTKIIDPMGGETQISIILKDLNLKKDIELPKPEDIQDQAASQNGQGEIAL